MPTRRLTTVPHNTTQARTADFVNPGLCSTIAHERLLSSTATSPLKIRFLKGSVGSNPIFGTIVPPAKRHFSVSRPVASDSSYWHSCRHFADATGCHASALGSTREHGAAESSGDEAAPHPSDEQRPATGSLPGASGGSLLGAKPLLPRERHGATGWRGLRFWGFWATSAPSPDGLSPSPLRR